MAYWLPGGSTVIWEGVNAWLSVFIGATIHRVSLVAYQTLFFCNACVVSLLVSYIYIISFHTHKQHNHIVHSKYSLGFVMLEHTIIIHLV